MCLCQFPKQDAIPETAGISLFIQSGVAETEGEIERERERERKSVCVSEGYISERVYRYAFTFSVYGA